MIRRFLGERGEGLNLIFLFDMLRFRFDAAFFRSQLRRYETDYGPPLMPTYVYSNHDNRRSIGRVGGDPQKAKLLALFQLTARGVAVTYQGEEIGMADTPMPQATTLDPVSHLLRLGAAGRTSFHPAAAQSRRMPHAALQWIQTRSTPASARRR